MTSPLDKDDERRRRVARILALALVWGVGILAILTERSATRRPVTARPAPALTAAIADAVQRSDDGRHGCTSSIDAKLEWTCGTAPPGSASFAESNCGESDTGPVHRVARIVRDAAGGPSRPLAD